MPTPQTQTPERFGGYEYWTERSSEAPKPVLLRRPVGGGRQQVLLDANEDAELDDVECWGQVRRPLCCQMKL